MAIKVAQRRVASLENRVRACTERTWYQQEYCIWDQIKRPLGMYMVMPCHTLVEIMHLSQGLA